MNDLPEQMILLVADNLDRGVSKKEIFRDILSDDRMSLETAHLCFRSAVLLHLDRITRNPR
jgi:hypothetical protein